MYKRQIILWGVRINESQDDDVFYRETNRVAHELDDTRATGGVPVSYTHLDVYKRQLSNDVDMSLVEKESYEYYKNELETGEYITYLVYDNGTFIGAGGVSFYQVMPTYRNSTGKKAYIMNMYTAPEYRRQGIAIHTLDLLSLIHI